MLSGGGRSSFVSHLQHFWLSMAISVFMDWIRRGGYSGYFRSIFSVYFLHTWPEIAAVIPSAYLAPLCLVVWYERKIRLFKQKKHTIFQDVKKHFDRTIEDRTDQGVFSGKEVWTATSFRNQVLIGIELHGMTAISNILLGIHVTELVTTI